MMHAAGNDTAGPVNGLAMLVRDSKGISQQNCYSELSSTILSHPELANTAFEPPPPLTSIACEPPGTY